MEGFPRLPMLGFKLKSSFDSVDFTIPFKSYITEFYSENAELYNKEYSELDQLRRLATSAPIDFIGCSNMKKYYCQIEFLLSRFPMRDGDSVQIPFTWEDLMSQQMITFTDIKFEQANMLYNIGSLHSKLGSMDNRMTPEGMKVSCTHFQCAAWTFQHLKDNFDSYKCLDFTRDLLAFQSATMLAQAQECILEKSMTDNRKSSITAKLSAQIVDYYQLAMKYLNGFTSLTSVGSKVTKEWKRRLELKIGFYECVTLYYMGLNAEEQSKWGERLGYLQAAVTNLEELMKNKLDDAAVDESLKFMVDVIGGKFNSAKKDNDFIYHEKVPNLDSLPEVKGASLVKGIPLNINDPEVSGPDIFRKLVPLKIHQKSSLYSEEKAKLLRKIGLEIEAKDAELRDFLSLLQIIPGDHILPESTKIPDILLEKCAAVSVRPNAIKNLIGAMHALSSKATDVEGDLDSLLKFIEPVERYIQEASRTLSIHMDGLKECEEIRRECSKHEETLKTTSQLNEELHKLMEVHISNLKILASPVQDVYVAISSLRYKISESEMEVLQDMKKLMDKVDHMSKQRKLLLEQLRIQIQKDDVTQMLMVAAQDHEELFKEQLEKHSQQVTLISQNLTAQANILHALTEANAKYTGIRKYLMEAEKRQGDFISGLIKSYEVYEDLLAKTFRGVEFYDKLSIRVTKLQGEAEHLMASYQAKVNKVNEKSALPPTTTKDCLKIDISKSGFQNIVQTNLGPDASNYLDFRHGCRLKDYLPFMKPETFGPRLGQLHYSHDNLDVQKVDIPHIPSAQSRSVPNSQAASPLCVTSLPSDVLPCQFNPAFGTRAALNGQHSIALSSDISVADTSKFQHFSQPATLCDSQQLSYQIPLIATGHLGKTISSSLSANSPITGHLLSGFQHGVQNMCAIPSPSISKIGQPGAISLGQSGGYLPHVFQQHRGDVSILQNPDRRLMCPPAFSFSDHHNSVLYPLPQGSIPEPVISHTQQLHQLCSQNHQVQPMSQPPFSQLQQFQQPMTQRLGHFHQLQQSQHFRMELPFQPVYNVTPSMPQLLNQHPTVATDTPVSPLNLPQSQGLQQDYHRFSLSHYFNQKHSSSTAPEMHGYPHQPVSAHPRIITNTNSPTFTSNTEPRILLQNAGMDNMVTHQNSIYHNLSTSHSRKSSLASLDEMLSNGGNISQHSTVLIPKVVTDEDLKRQQDEEAKHNLKLNTKDPYSDAETLSKFVAEVEKFNIHVDNLSKLTSDKITLLEEEWKRINEVQERSTKSFSMAIARCYPLKNRFPDIMPFDNSRVKLLGAVDDYINASLIKSTSLACPDIIATQVPSPATFSDFWQMVYDYNVEVIVMLCSEAEATYKQGQVYWPTDKGQKVTSAGHFNITLHSIQAKPSWTERVISITHSKFQVSRSVIHLLFQSWPLGAEPESVDALLQFISYIHGLYLQQRSLVKPIIVHCSNGIGRTGAFAVIYRGLEEINKGQGIINVCDVVNQMRTQRKFFVEFERQFKFCYKAILFYGQNILKNYGILTTAAAVTNEKTVSESHHSNQGANLNQPECGNTVETQSGHMDVRFESAMILVDDHLEIQRQLPTAERSPDHATSTELSSLSVIDIQNPDKFFIDSKATIKKKVTKANFFSQTGLLINKPTSSDPLDPFSELDPMWTLKK